MQIQRFTVGLAFVSLAGFASGDVVVHEQLPDYKNLYYADQGGPNRQHIADNFTLVRDEEISSISFWGAYTTDDPLDDLFTIRFYMDNNDGVGSLIHSTPINSTQRNPAGTILDSFDLFHYQANLTLPFEAQAGTTYWISIRNNTFSMQFESWTWATGAGPDDGYAHSRPGLGGWGREFTHDLAFTLQAVPSPTTLAIACIACIPVIRRRRSN